MRDGQQRVALSGGRDDRRKVHGEAVVLNGQIVELTGEDPLDFAVMRAEPRRLGAVALDKARCGTLDRAARAKQRDNGGWSLGCFEGRH